MFSESKRKVYFCKTSLSSLLGKIIRTEDSVCRASAIGSKIRELRIKNGLTQEELANRSELSKGFISQVESEQTSPSIATLVDILECLGTNLRDFFSESVDRKNRFWQGRLFYKRKRGTGAQDHLGDPKRAEE